jgi:hypothetical protein
MTNLKEIMILPKAEPVQHRRDHLASPGSCTPIRSTQTQPGSVVAHHTVKAA